MHVRPLLVALALTACSADNNRDAGLDAAVGGPVTGAADTHCAADGGTVVTVNTNACMSTGNPDDDGGLVTDDGDDDYGATLFNTSGDDDDCKYHATYTSTPITENGDVTLTVTATYKANGMPVTGANTRAEIVLGDTHVAPNTHPTTTESTPGTYVIGPVRFDQAGQWTVRYHFFENCTDAPDSPHGHIAFYVAVP